MEHGRFGRLLITYLTEEETTMKTYSSDPVFVAERIQAMNEVFEQQLKAAKDRIKKFKREEFNVNPNLLERLTWSSNVFDAAARIKVLTHVTTVFRKKSLRNLATFDRILDHYQKLVNDNARTITNTSTSTLSNYCDDCELAVRAEVVDRMSNLKEHTLRSSSPYENCFKKGVIV